MIVHAIVAKKTLVFVSIVKKGKGAHEPKAQNGLSLFRFHEACLGLLLLPPRRDASPSKGWDPFIHLGPVIRTPVSAIPGLNFNPGFFFFLSKALSRIIFSILFRVSNHQIVGKDNKTEFDC